MPVFKGDAARYTLLAHTDDTSEAIWLFEMFEEELRAYRERQKGAPDGSECGMN